MSSTSVGRLLNVGLLRRLRARDAGLSALRRAVRAAVLMPALFALGTQVLDNPALATFAAFGSFAMLLLVDFGGPLRDRLAAQACLIVAGAALVCLGTLAARDTALAVTAMVVVGFLVIFAGIVSSTLAGATTAVLLGFILPVTLPGPVSSIPDRVEGWLLAGAVSMVAIVLLWPAPVRNPLRVVAAQACHRLADRLQAEVAYVRGGRTDRGPLDAAIADGTAAITALRMTFFATPYRPTALTTAARTVVRLVDELVWLCAILDRTTPGTRTEPVDPSVCDVKLAAATLLEHSAALLDDVSPAIDALRDDLQRLADARHAMERIVTGTLPVERAADCDACEAEEFVSSLEPSFRAQEMSFAVTAIARNVTATVAAQRRRWRDQLLGRQPEGVAGRLTAAQRRAGAHVERHSVWLHNSLRGAVGLGGAVLVADLTGVQHSFWVVLGTLSVLRSNALNTGQNVLRGLLGTVAGFVVGGVLVYGIGTNSTLLWALLPIVIVFAGMAPAVISFAAGQAGFTVTLLILYNLIAPVGWRVGLVRIEDIAVGSAVSLVVGALFWPRGAARALAVAVAEAYDEGARYLRAAVEYGVQRCDASALGPASADAEALRSAAAASRLDDAFRGFLAERGTKDLPLPQVTALITGVAGLRLTAEAVLDLWRRDDGTPTGDRSAARALLLDTTGQVARWYATMAGALTGTGEVPDPLPHDRGADRRLIDSVRRDLNGTDGQGTATAVRMIWSGDHVDAARRLQQSLVEPVRAAVEVQRRTLRLLPRRPERAAEVAVEAALADA